MPLPDYKNAIKEDIGAIYITGGGFINREFRGIGRDSKLGWQELVWSSSPTRALNFAFSDMDNTDVGLVARCELNLKYMNIQDYMDLRKIVARERHFMVKFFDVDEGKWVTRDMYCTESSMSQLYNMKQSLIGVIDCTIKFVGTNLDLETTYKDNIDQDNNISFTMTYNYGSFQLPYDKDGFIEKKGWGDSLKLPEYSGLSKGSYKWVCRKGGAGSEKLGEYLPTQTVTIWDNMNFYAESNV